MNSLLKILIIASIVTGCNISKNAVQDELSAPYVGTELNIKPEFKIFHYSLDTSYLFIKFETEQLLYVKNGDDYTASLLVEVDPITSDEITDEKIQFKRVEIPEISLKRKGQEVMAKIQLALPINYKYGLNIKIIDRANRKESSHVLETDKQSVNSRENFLIFEADNEIPVFNDRIKRNTSYTIDYGLAGSRKILVSYYNRSFPLPPPPFAYFEPKPFDYQPDDQFEIILDSGKFEFRSADEGFYHFRINENDKKGLTLFISNDEGFPLIDNIETMTNPFRYLVSGKEFKKLLEAPVLKVELEAFWIDWSGDKSRARNNIKTYYNRVETSNRFFSSHVEGWQSDRGLIYIIYGEPNKIYKTSNLETWIYGEEQNPLSIMFRFIKVDNPFTANDYRLDREDYYKPSWYRSIESWRNGRVY